MSETKLSSTPDELEKLFMDPNRAKTEAEHWAVREIEKLRAELDMTREQLLIDTEIAKLEGESNAQL